MKRIYVRSAWAGKYSHTKAGYTSNILLAIWWFISWSIIEAIRVFKLNRYHRKNKGVKINFCYAMTTVNTFQ